MRALSPIEQRILGSLMEKQQATPEYYPLTLNALATACNQKTSREPVTDYTEGELDEALERLQYDKLVWRIVGGRAVRWDHNLVQLLGLQPPEKAVLTLLLLRGPQTPGELRSRSDRLHDFASVAEVEETLAELSRRASPIAIELPRQPGQSSTRWAHMLGGEIDVSARAPVQQAPPARREGVDARLTALEEAVAKLADELERLKSLLGA